MRFKVVCSQSISGETTLPPMNLSLIFRGDFSVVMTMIGRISQHLTFLLLLLLAIGCAAVTKKNGADCKANTCKNGGTCNTFTPSPPCICVLPYIAPNCATAADYCKTLQPDKNITALPVCQNGGACTLTYTDPFFNCTCPPNFYGIRCQFRVTTSAPTTIEITTETYQDATSSRYSDGINATLMPSTKSPGPVDSNPFDSLLVKSLAIGIPSAIVLALIIAGVIALIVKCRNCGKGSGSRYV
ncbi:hypothetical protein BOX15_Mlig019213g1 [Macrostomum lignano]|uniref:EGF-like domain-containing protein n=1 Tax=Macrostomum lignano TaxID=282301 RepID=A0A267FAW0_9PLAT|nr:hypothetical protein BOX15_Mlig019213g1 [Macrostomum lignano]